MTIIGFSTVNVAPATTGNRTPNSLVIPADWMIVAMPQTSRSALTRMAISRELKPIAAPTISGTAMAPAYIMKSCCKPKAANSGNGGT